LHVSSLSHFLTIMIQRVLASPAACALVEELRSKHGELLFHQSGGCCDGFSPMCHEAGDSNILLVGEVCGGPFWMSRDQYEYWKHAGLTLGTVPGRGSSFARHSERFSIHDPQPGVQRFGTD
jgi:uncharacterized protein (DUF779 family)